MIRAYRGIVPTIDPSVYIDPGAQVIGDVVIGPRSSVWCNTVIRGDVNTIRIGARTNIQDLSVLHVTRRTASLVIGDEVTVGHGVILHGCRVADRCLIGIGAIVLDGVEIESDCLIAAGSLVAPGTRIPSGHLAKGSPAKVARPLRPDELAHLKQSAANYVEHAAAYRVSREA